MHHLLNYRHLVKRTCKAYRLDMDQIPLSPTVDGVSVGCIRDGAFLLVERGRDPSKGWLAFPGGRREDGETPQEAAIRELNEETGLSVAIITYLTTVTFDYSTPEFPPPDHSALLFFEPMMFLGKQLLPMTRQQFIGCGMKK